MNKKDLKDMIIELAISRYYKKKNITDFDIRAIISGQEKINQKECDYIVAEIVRDYNLWGIIDEKTN